MPGAAVGAPVTVRGSTRHLLDGPASGGVMTPPDAGHRAGHASPGGVQGASLGEARRALEPDDRSRVELLERARAGIRAAAPQPGDDLVDDVLDRGAQRVDVHSCGADALLEERLAGAVVRRVARRAAAHRARARHAEGLLVLTAVVVGVEVAGRLERAGEPGADHDVGGTGRE